MLAYCAYGLANPDFQLEVDKDPDECFGLSTVDAATDVRLKFPLSIGDPKKGSLDSADAPLKMPGLGIVPAGVDAENAARESWAKLRVLTFQASELAAGRDGGMSRPDVAYSLVCGYGFFAVPEPDVRVPVSAANKLPLSPAYCNSFRALTMAAPDFDEIAQERAEHESDAATDEHKLRFPKKLFSQLVESAKRAKQRRQQSHLIHMP